MFMSLISFIPAPYRIWAAVAAVTAIIGGTYTVAQHRQFKYDEAAQAVKTLAVERAANKALQIANDIAVKSNERFAKIQQDAEVKNHESQIIIDTTRTQLATIKRLRDPYRKPADCGGLSKDTTSPGIAIDQTTSGGLSEELDGFLKRQAYEADQVAVYANTCHEWASKLGAQD